MATRVFVAVCCLALVLSVVMASEIAPKMENELKISTLLSNIDKQIGQKIHTLRFAQKGNSNTTEAVNPLEAEGTDTFALTFRPSGQSLQVLSQHLLYTTQTINHAKTLALQRRQQLQALVHQLEHEKAVLLEWVSKQKTAAMQSLGTQKRNLKKLVENLEPLQTAYNQAKSRSEEISNQIRQLVAEHHLQQTPPITPGTMLIGMSDVEFNTKMTKLQQMGRAAVAEMNGAATNIAKSKNMIATLSNWITQSYNALNQWLREQQSAIVSRLQAGKLSVESLKAQIRTFYKLLEEARKLRVQYQLAIIRVKYETQTQYLQHQLGQVVTEENVASSELRAAAAVHRTINEQLHRYQGRLDKLETLQDPTATGAPPASWQAILNQAEAESPTINSHVFPTNSVQLPAVPGFATSGDVLSSLQI